MTEADLLCLGCGACKIGVLVPLFKVRAPRTPQKTKADSRMAAIRGRGETFTGLSRCHRLSTNPWL